MADECGIKAGLDFLDSGSESHLDPLLPEHELKLKFNTVVILLPNMDIKGGHCNGTRYLVKHIGQYNFIWYSVGVHSIEKSVNITLMN